MAKWVLDPTHSAVNFSARHMMVTTVRGSFKLFSATIDFDPANPQAGKVEAEIDASSIETGVADRDNHLRSPDFLDVATYPKLTFVSKHVDIKGDNSGVITGDLTIRGVTREVRLETEFLGQFQDPFGNQKAAFTASTKINREDWGLVWNVALEAGGVLVSKDVKIEIELQAVPAPVTAAV
jgi:polyisoprenoid-binding protein YceI